MAFVPHTEEERKEMLASIGVASFDELISNIPEEIRLKGDLNIAPKLSEYEVTKLLTEYAARNKSADRFACFMGGGAYDHFVPSIVGSVLERPEFKTAYTPYQAEVSQGTLQAMYEFQSMICALTGMDISNASMYDGGSALAEACLMANAYTRKTEILIAGTIQPFFRQVMDTVTVGRKLEFRTFIGEDGRADLEALRAAISDKTAAVVVQTPNAYGNLEDVRSIEQICHTQKALFIVAVNPLSLGAIEAPANYNADVVVGEGQPLGIPLSYGGPYLGFFACKKEFVRVLPGRICGVTEDEEGKRGFVLTLQTREQQIKREKATSNICTNQGLFMLAATVYMETMGKEGVAEASGQCLQKAHYLAKRISEIPGFKLMNDKPFFNEFLVETPVPAVEIIRKGTEKGILPGVDTSYWPEMKQGLLVAVTEKRTKEEMDALVEILKEFSK
ncbi:MAG: aminomethyl-transferring glycine dehydrogenase subunit GcvPA [Chloroflexota bacterium]